jgi:hypothetical protein
MSALLIGIILVFVFVAVLLPVKLAAGWMGADRNDFMSCFFAVILAIVINVFASMLVKYGTVVSIFVAAIAYMLVLGTTYLRAIAIELLSIAILYGMLAILIALGIAPAVFKTFTAADI